MKRRRAQAPEEDFQMAPMIDMVFLLLVFFMCVSSLSQAERSVEVELAESETSQVPEDLADRGTLALDAEGTLYLGARPMSVDSLAAVLRERIRETPELRIHLRVDQSVAFREVRKVLRACAEAGAHDVIYATYQSH